MIAANYSVRVLITVFSLVVALTAISEAAPVVNSTIPAADATNVAINIPVIATFSEAMNGATINSTNFKLEKLVPGTMTLTIHELAGPTSTYTGYYTTALYAGIYRGTFSGDDSGNFVTGVSGDGELKGFSYDSDEADYFNATIYGSSPWSFNATSSEGTYLSGTINATSTWGSWSNEGHDGSFSGSKVLGDDGSAGYSKDVYTASSYDWIAAAEVSGSTIRGYVVDSEEPDVYYGTGTVSADKTFSIPEIRSLRYNTKVATGTGTLNPAGQAVAGSVSYDSSNLSATFTPSASLAANTSYRATVTTGVRNASEISMAADKVWTFTTGTSTAKKLSVAISGSGDGEVTSSPSGIDCSYSPQGGFCSAYFTGSPVSLAAAAYQGSLFSGWGGDCAGCSTTPCSVTLTGSKSCSAGFALKMVIINGDPDDGYATLQKAYYAAGDDDLLEVRSGTLTENVLLDDEISVTISGGYNSDFSSPTGVTTIDGSLTIAKGTLTVEDMSIM